MMRYKLVFVLFLAMFLSCSQAKKLNYSGKGKIEKFELARFEKLKSKGKTEEILSDGTIISYIETTDLYQEKIKKDDSPFSKIKQYDKMKLYLKSEMNFFYDMPIGVHNEFDSDGIIVKSTDYDKIFTFTLEDLAVKVKELLGIDIYKDKNFGIGRQTENLSQPYYTIDIKSGGGRSNTRIIRIDGKTGEVIYDGVSVYRK